MSGRRRAKAFAALRVSYVYNMVDYQKFSVRNYKAWVDTVDADERF